MGELLELCNWIENTQLFLNGVCHRLHWVPEDLLESPWSDQTQCTVCSLEVPTTSYSKHLTACQIKKMLPHPEDMVCWFKISHSLPKKTNPSSLPFYTEA